MTATLALQLAIAGISVGSIYALVALAIVIPFKASGVLNFGQGEIVTFGAYAALILTQLALPYPVVLAGVLILGSVGGIVIERVLIRPIIKAPEFTLVIATFAIGLLIKGVISIALRRQPQHDRRAVRHRSDRRSPACVSIRRRCGSSPARRW